MNTTSIMDLPSDMNMSSLQQQQSNITFNVNDVPPQSIDTKLLPNNVSLDQNTINQIVSGLQQASSTGATQLQSRDIPINKVQFMDEQVQQEYIPSTNVKNEFIEEEDEEEENTTILNNYTKRLCAFTKMENIYSNLQIPVLLSILYFIFQLPFFKSQLFKHIPALFFGDGNINIYGQLFMSVLFGILYYICSLLLTF